MIDISITNTSIKQEYETTYKDRWAGSPFEWIRRMAPARKGTIGRKFVENFAVQSGLTVTSKKDLARKKGRNKSDFDTIIERILTEVKLSMLWDNDTFVFEQLRDQTYEYAFLLGLLPSGEILAWAIPKDVLLDHAEAQHGGKNGKDTKWLRFSVNNVPEWLSAYGGTVEKAFDCLKG